MMKSTEEEEDSSLRRSSSWKRRMREEFEAKLEEHRKEIQAQRDLFMERFSKMTEDKLSLHEDKKRVKTMKKKQEDVKSNTIKKDKDEILKLPKAKCVLSSKSVKDVCDISFEKTDIVLEIRYILFFFGLFFVSHRKYTKL